MKRTPIQQHNRQICPVTVKPTANSFRISLTSPSRAAKINPGFRRAPECAVDGCVISFVCGSNWALQSKRGAKIDPSTSPFFLRLFFVHLFVRQQVVTWPCCGDDNGPRTPYGLAPDRWRIPMLPFPSIVRPGTDHTCESQPDMRARAHGGNRSSARHLTCSSKLQP